MIWKWDAWKRDAIKALHYYIISEEGNKYVLKGVKKKENQK